MSSSYGLNLKSNIFKRPSESIIFDNNNDPFRPIYTVKIGDALESPEKLNNFLINDIEKLTGQEKLKRLSEKAEEEQEKKTPFFKMSLNDIFFNLALVVRDLLENKFKDRKDDEKYIYVGILIVFLALIIIFITY